MTGIGERVLERIFPAADAPKEKTFAEMQEEVESRNREIAELADKQRAQLMTLRDELNAERLAHRQTEQTAKFYKEQHDKQVMLNRVFAKYVAGLDARLATIVQLIGATQDEAKKFALADKIKELTEDTELKPEDQAELQGLVQRIANQSSSVHGNQPEEQERDYPPREPIRTTPMPPMNFAPSER